MKCKYCGGKVSFFADYCPSCGKKTIAKKLGKTSLTQYEEAYIEKYLDLFRII